MCVVAAKNILIVTVERIGNRGCPIETAVTDDQGLPAKLILDRLQICVR